MEKEIEKFLQYVYDRNPNEPEFHQAVEETVNSVYPLLEKNPKYREAKILERIVEPERVISFKVVWLDDKDNVQVNRGYRIQFNSAIGPYKGGLRFHPSVNLSILKFLGFEQIFKNSLTGLPMGGAKGGSDFDPKGKSDNEVMRFCQAFMSELFRHIGSNTDIPAGDIGVGAREIGYLFGQYKRLANEFSGVLTGKDIEFGGSLIRPEATGYGAVYFVVEMLKTKGENLEGKTVAISGSGNVAQHAAEEAIELGAKVVTMSDSSGFVYDKDGITGEKLAFIMDLKNKRRGRIEEYAKKYQSEYYKEKKPWQEVKFNIALPSATENEIDESDARSLLDNGVELVAEGANMASTKEAVRLFLESKILYGPSKAVNAGGVAVSGLEMSQNSIKTSWTREEVCRRLEEIMKNIHKQCVEYGKQGNYINYVDGANKAGFIKVADAMLDQGLVS
ncbi:MAG: NADP-specific glutamate dehydrogenase [Patescibacteria group bacterium]|nr:NADP-specific glutamate dehydrogenase [Patescibacteria group bacterium]